MVIPSELPQALAAARASALQALGLKAGQVLDAKVIGPAPNGGTQVQVNGQLLNLVLPTLLAAGTPLRLEVQGSGAQLQLAMQVPGATPPANPAPMAMTPDDVGLPQMAAAQTAQSASSQSLPSTLPAGAPPVPATALPAAAVPPTGPAAAALPGAAPAAPAGGQAVATAAAPMASAMPAASVAPELAAPLAQAAYRAAPAAVTPSSAIAAEPALPNSPQAALSQMVHQEVQRQDTMQALTTALTAIAGRVALPEPVLRAAQAVLAGQVPLSEGALDGAGLQKAVQNSGLFQEAGLAKGTVPSPQTDMKSALLGLRQNLTAWLGQMATLIPAAAIAPPLRGGVPRARGAEAPPIDPVAAPEEIGKHMLDHTDAALGRLRLHQHASLPDQASAQAPADWSLDLPVLIGQQQSILHLQIHRDAQHQSEAEGERGWQMRFAMALPALGEVGAQVSLRGVATGVMLWAEEPATAAALDSELPSLREALAGIGLQAGSIFVRQGAPLQLTPAPSGHFVDSSS